MTIKRCALVTGASGGLGREIAVSLAASAGAVIIHYFRNRKGAEETARRARKLGAESAVVQADLASEEEARNLVVAAEKVRGRLDILVNNVGPIRIKPWDRLSGADWEDALRKNLLAPISACPRSCPGCGAAVRSDHQPGVRPGRAAGRLSDMLPYAAAKTGLLLLTRTAAAESRGTNVTINMVSPGLLEKGILPAGVKVPPSALGTFADVAAAVRFLAAEASRRITGTNILVAGTWKM